MTEPIVVTVPLGDRSYPVHVGHGALSALPTLIPTTARRAAVVTQAGIPFGDDVSGAARAARARRHPRSRSGRGVAEVAHHRRAPCRRVRRRGDHEPRRRRRRRWRHGHRRRRLRRRGVAPGRAGRARRRPPCSAWSTRRSAARPASTRARARTSSGRSGSRPASICDLDALDTLPPRERRSGDGEMAKYHFLVGEDLDGMPLAERVARCVAIKADGRRVRRARGRPACAAELRPHAGPRARDRHRPRAHPRRERSGSASSTPPSSPSDLERIGAGRVAQHREVVGDLRAADRPIPPGLDADELMALMVRDKKALDGLTFVLDGPGRRRGGRRRRPRHRPSGARGTHGLRD